MAGPLLAQQPDYLYRRSIRYEIIKTDSGAKATSEEIVSYVYRAEKSLKGTVFTEHETFFNKITDLECSLNGRSVSDKWIKTRIPKWDDTFLNDDRIWTIEMPVSAQVGDSIEYVVERSWDDVSYIPIIRVPNYNMTKSYIVEVEHSEDMTVNFTVFPSVSKPVYRIDRPDSEHTRIVFDEIPYAAPFVGFPHNDVHCFVELDILQNGKSLVKSKPRTFSDWYSGWFDQRCDLSPEDRSQVFAGIKDARNAVDTLRHLHDYIRSNIRYVADERNVNALVPRSPKRVLQQGFGDCKDRAHFISSLARSLGYNVGMALIHTGHPPATTETVHISQFNHVICYAVIGGDTLFFDPTARFSPFGTLPHADVDKPVFLIHANSPRWSRTRRSIQQPTLTIAGTVDINKTSSVPAIITLRNEMASQVMYATTSSNESDTKRYLSNLIAGDLHRIKVVDPILESKSDSLVTIKATLDMSQYFVRGTGPLYSPLQPSRFLDANILERRNDTMPLTVYAWYDVLVRLRFRGEGLAVRDTSVSMTGPLDVIHTTTMKTGDDGAPYFESRTKLTSATYNGKDKESLLDFCQSYIRLRRNMISLTN